MNNLYRELAPITDAAWEQIEQEASRTFKRWIAGRRVVDVSGPAGSSLAAVGSGHQRKLTAPAPGVEARQRQAQLVVELRVPFTLGREQIDDVDRGAQDSDWQPVKTAVQQLALAEDQAVLHGSKEAGITGIVESTSNTPIAVPADVRELPNVVSQALSELRLAGVDGPYALLLSADLYTQASEVTDHGYPVRDHLARLLDGEIIWAPALEGGLLVTTRGGDYELCLGQDVSIGYLSHDANNVHLYHQESFTFFAYTSEASVPLTTS